jgi:hypothetical protein
MPDDPDEQNTVQPVPAQFETARGNPDDQEDLIQPECELTSVAQFLAANFVKRALPILRKLNIFDNIGITIYRGGSPLPFGAQTTDLTFYVSINYLRIIFMRLLPTARPLYAFSIIPIFAVAPCSSVALRGRPPFWFSY